MANIDRGRLFRGRREFLSQGSLLGAMLLAQAKTTAAAEAFELEEATVATLQEKMQRIAHSPGLRPSGAHRGPELPGPQLATSSRLTERSPSPRL
jgi:hypothetical protein